METLQKLIRAKGRRQRDLAKAINVSEPIMSRWANRTTDIPARAIRPLADALGISVDEVLAVATVPHVDAAASHVAGREAA